MEAFLFDVKCLDLGTFVSSGLFECSWPDWQLSQGFLSCCLVHVLILNPIINQDSLLACSSVVKSTIHAILAAGFSIASLQGCYLMVANRPMAHDRASWHIM